MSKEYLEALEIECGELVEMDLLFLDRNGENQEKWHNSEAFNKAVEFEKKYGKSHTYILKQALQRLESIDNANPSEALETLEDLRKQVSFANSDGCIFNDIYEAIIRDIEFIKQALLKAQEQEKMLDAIKGKVIWVENGKLMCGRYADTEIELEEDDFENSEVFDLLKRYFNE